MGKLISSLFIIFLFFSSHCFCQRLFINLYKARIKKDLAQYTIDQNVKTITEETDSNITLLVRDSSVETLDLILSLDRHGKCYREVRKFGCDSCFRKILNKRLNNEKLKWIKISDKEYISNSYKKICLEIDDKNPFSFVITKISRKQYKTIASIKVP